MRNKLGFCKPSRAVHGDQVRAVRLHMVTEVPCWVASTERIEGPGALTAIGRRYAQLSRRGFV